MVLFPSWAAASVVLSPAASPPQDADGAAWPESMEPQTVNNNKHVQTVFFFLLQTLSECAVFNELRALGSSRFKTSFSDTFGTHIERPSADSQLHNNFFLFTRNSCEELHSISVTVEGELSLSHGAVRNKRPCRHFVAAVVAVHPDCTPWLVTLCLGYLVGR